jgi:hypothetical protein
MRRIRTPAIVNPESNQGATRRRWKEIQEAIHLIKGTSETAEDLARPI